MTVKHRLLSIRESVVVLTAIDTEIRQAETSCRVCTEQLQAAPPGESVGELMLVKNYNDVMRRQRERIETLKAARQKILSQPLGAGVLVAAEALS